MPISKAPKGEWPPVTDLEGGEVNFEEMKCPTLIRRAISEKRPKKLQRTAFSVLKAVLPIGIFQIRT